MPEGFRWDERINPRELESIVFQVCTDQAVTFSHNQSASVDELFPWQCDLGPGSSLGVPYQYHILGSSKAPTPQLCACAAHTCAHGVRRAPVTEFLDVK